MYCSECGTQLGSSAKYCTNCGQAVFGDEKSGGQIAPSPYSVKSPSTAKAAASLGTKWLRFWTYFSLPMGGALGLLLSMTVPKLGVILVPYAVLQFWAAYGLHHRRLWAWRWNWALVVAAFVTMSIPTPVPGAYHRGADLAIQFTIKLAIVGLIWMWPNYVYWRKRRPLFS